MKQIVFNEICDTLRKDVENYDGNKDDFLMGVRYGILFFGTQGSYIREAVKMLIDENKKKTEIVIDSPRIVELGFSVRLINCLKGAGIETLNELLRINAASLLLLQNFGKKTLQELQKYYEENGYTFGNEYLERIHVDNRYVYWLKGKKYNWFL